MHTALDDAMHHCEARETRRVIQAELVHYILAVLLGGFDTDAESRGDLFVAQPFRHELQNFRLAGRELGADLV